MRTFVPHISAYAFWTTTDTHIYISREILIEHPSVGLASLAQLPVVNGRLFFDGGFLARTGVDCAVGGVCVLSDVAVMCAILSGV